MVHLDSVDCYRYYRYCSYCCCCCCYSSVVLDELVEDSSVLLVELAVGTMAELESLVLLVVLAVGTMAGMALVEDIGFVQVGIVR